MNPQKSQTAGIEGRQYVLLSFLVCLLIIDSAMLMYDYNIRILSISVFHIELMLLPNLLVNRISFATIQDSFILAPNIWKTRRYPVEELMS